MTITEMRFFEVKNADPKLLAFVQITFDNCFVVKDIKYLRSEFKSFVSFPEKRAMIQCEQCKRKNPFNAMYCMFCSNELPMKIDDGQPNHYSFVFPITKEFRQYVEEEVSKGYEQWRNSSGVPLQTLPN